MGNGDATFLAFPQHEHGKSDSGAQQFSFTQAGPRDHLTLPVRNHEELFKFTVYHTLFYHGGWFFNFSILLYIIFNLKILETGR